MTTFHSSYSLEPLMNTWICLMQIITSIIHQSGATRLDDNSAGNEPTLDTLELFECHLKYINIYVYIRSMQKCSAKTLIDEDKETLDVDLWSVFLPSCWWSRTGIWDWEPDPGLLLPRRAAYGTHPPHTSIFHHHPPLLSPLLCWVPNGTLVWPVGHLNSKISALFHPHDSRNGSCLLKCLKATHGRSISSKLLVSIPRNCVKWCQVTGT